MAEVRAPLSRRRVLEAAISLADTDGLDTVSMRRLADHLGVVPMALYKHVANKEMLLDGMVDLLIEKIVPPVSQPGGWRAAVRGRAVAAREALERHPWARQAIESRTNKSPAVLAYLDAVIGEFLASGFSTDLTHHVMHALGSRVWGLTQDVFEDPPGQPAAVDLPPEMLAALGARYPNVLRMAMANDHDPASVIGQGCDDRFEFEFALDLLLDGFQRLHDSGWSSVSAKAPRTA